MPTFKLQKKIFIEGRIWLETGLHIGGTNAAMNIGGIDKAVVRNPITQEPYIPGSSLKGKMRCLYEQFYGQLGDSMGKNVKHGPSDDINSNACRLFGLAHDVENRPSRLIVRDAPMLTNPEYLKHTDLLYTEQKTEVVIDRITSAAMPRQFERVPAGVCFKLDMVLNVFDSNDEKHKDNEQDLIKHTLEAMKLLEDDTLGGQGSRGYGKIKIEITSVTEKDSAAYQAGGSPKPHGEASKFTEHFQKPASAVLSSLREASPQAA